MVSIFVWPNATYSKIVWRAGFVNLCTTAREEAEKDVASMLIPIPMLTRYKAVQPKNTSFSRPSLLGRSIDRWIADAGGAPSQKRTT